MAILKEIMGWFVAALLSGGALLGVLVLFSPHKPPEIWVQVVGTIVMLTVWIVSLGTIVMPLSRQNRI